MSKRWDIKLDGRRWSETKIIKEIIKSRGIKDYEHFICPTIDDLIPLNHFKYIYSAASLVLSTIKNDGKILIHYDTDQDGVASGSIIYRYLKNLTSNIRTTINEGKIHGITYLDSRLLDGIQLMIVVDSMEDDAQTYKNLLDRGIKIIVLDHHVPTQEVIDMAKDINLVSSAVDYDNPALSGAGVCLKFAMALDELTENSYADHLYDLASVGICADMCDVGESSMENRYICYRGFNNVENPAIKMINGSYEMNSTAVGFGIAPLTNAGMRTNKNLETMRLFSVDNEAEIKDIIKTLKEAKTSQSDMINKLFSEIEWQAKE